MENKFLIFGVVAILLLLSVAVFLKLNSNGDSVQINNEDLSKYRSTEIPEACRIPESGYDVKSWTEHLSHHQNTWYCLEYYK